MTTSKTVIDEKYDAALQSLKKINNDLFYDELKELINKREAVIVEKNEEVYDNIEKMLSELKEIQKDDHLFVQLQTEKIVTSMEDHYKQMAKKLAEGFKEQELLANQHFEIFTQQFQYILHELHTLKSNQLIWQEDWSQKYLKEKEERMKSQTKWEEKWKQSIETRANRENTFKKWLMALAVGQGISIIILILQFFL